MKRYILILVMLVSSFAYGQESRSTLTGHVTDPLGVAVLHVKVVATNMDTGAKTITFTTSAGDYTVPFLYPGRYEVTATYAGFKTYVHPGLTLQSEQTVTENIVLAIGKVDESITVHGDAPLVDSATVNISQELTAQEAAELPSWGRSPLGFAHMEYGAVAKGKHSMSETRPFDNSTASDFSLGGGSSQSNELLLNGVPNMQDGARQPAFSPELDAVNAVHVDEFSANADLGDTSGGIVNITTKGGTNQFHGSASEYYDGSRPFQAQQYGFGAIPSSNATSLHYNQFAGTIGGPILIPHVIHGRDKLFFFYSFEGYIGKSPATTITTVPSDAERQGDFSALLSPSLSTATPNPYQLYDPYISSTGTPITVGASSVTRKTIANNCLTNTTTYCATNGNAGYTLSPIAKAYMALIPEANYNGPSTTADGENNYFVDDPSSNNYKSNQARLDWNVSNSNKFYVEAHRSHYLTSSADIFQNVLTGSTSTNIMWGGTLDDVHTFSPSTTLETRLGFSRYESYGGPKSLGTDPTTFGFPGYISTDSTAKALPYLTFSDASPIPSLSGNPSATENYDNIQLFSSLSKTWSRHTFKGGIDIRSSKESYLNPSSANGQFAFSSGNNDFVTLSPTGSASGTAKQKFGGAFALFDLGLPTSGSYAVNAGDVYSNWYMAGFLQDDWKILPNLSISVGMRVEHETPDVESADHIVAGWNPNIVNAATTQAKANYATTYATLASNPAYPILPATISPTGGMVYAGTGSRSPYHTADAYLSPRIGFSYTPGFWQGSFTIRGGFAIYVNPFGLIDFGQGYGYSQTSTMLTKNPSCITTNCLPANPATDPMLSDPFPTSSATGASLNPVLQPFGNSMSINTQLGAGITYYAPNVHVPYAEKWTLDLQKQVGKSWLFEVGYVGTHQVHNSYNNTISSAAMYSYLSPTATAASAGATAVSNEMTKTLTNPFLGLFPAYPNGSGANTTGLNTGATISVANAISAYPEYSSVVEALDPGVSQNFNALLARVQKRMSAGLDFFFNYQWSRQLGYVNPLNTGGPLWHGETTSDFPQHGSLALTYEFPFGRGRTFLGNTNRIMDEVAGGWKITGIYEFLSGTPNSWGNVNYNGNWSFNNRPHESVVQSFNTTQFDTTSGTNDQPGSYNLRTFPQYLLRTDPTKNTSLSMLKNFTIWQRVVFQPRFDAFNVFNRHQLNAPNLTPTSSAFGKISSQINTGRNMQVGVHILF